MRAYEKTKKYGINTCVHVILDCFETPEETMETAQALADLDVDGIKIHQLVVLQGTQLEKMYANNEFSLMEEKEYISESNDSSIYLEKEKKNLEIFEQIL